MPPKISIVFTSYNHREYLTEALESLINQTFRDFELIIIDDCSTDGSQEVLKSFSNDPRVKLHLLEKNSGSYVISSNLGSSKAVAEYIIFAQCDDYAESTQLEKLYEVVKKNPSLGVVFSSSNLIDKTGKYLYCDFDGRELKFKQHYSRGGLIPGKMMGEYLLHSCVIPNLSAALIKNSLFKKLKGLSSDYLVLADWDFWFRMSLESDFYYIREPLNNFRQHDTTIRNSVRLQRQVKEVFSMYYEFFEMSEINFKGRLRSEFIIANIWLDYFWGGKVPWLKSFFSLQVASLRFAFYFPLIFIFASISYPFTLINRKLQKSKQFI
jgi:glycosyltransferase involved in cell wall biosynthesis